MNANKGIYNSILSKKSGLCFQLSGIYISFLMSRCKHTSAIINDAIKNFVSNVYYQQYNCGYWDCFSKYSPPLFLISEKSQQYWSNLLYIALAVSVLSIVLLFFLFRRKYDLLFFSGGILVVFCLAILGIGKLLATLSNQVISNIATSLFFPDRFCIPKVDNCRWRFDFRGIDCGIV